MLQVTSPRSLDAVEPALRHAAQQRGANLIAVTHLGIILRDKHLKGPRDVIVFTVCQPELSATLLAAETRFAALLPCRVAAYSKGDSVLLQALPASEGCRLFERPDLEVPAALLDDALLKIMEEAAEPASGPVHAGAAVGHPDVGATEEQVNFRGMVPQRIDCRGSKVEEIAGTGEHDSSGG